MLSADSSRSATEPLWRVAVEVKVRGCFGLPGWDRLAHLMPSAGIVTVSGVGLLEFETNVVGRAVVFLFAATLEAAEDSVRQRLRVFTDAVPHDSWHLELDSYAAPADWSDDLTPDRLEDRTPSEVAAGPRDDDLLIFWSERDQLTRVRVCEQEDAITITLSGAPDEPRAIYQGWASEIPGGAVLVRLRDPIGQRQLRNGRDGRKLELGARRAVPHGAPPIGCRQLIKWWD